MLRTFSRDPLEHQVFLADQGLKEREVVKDRPDHKAQLESEDQLVDKAVPERMENLALSDMLYDVMLNNVL